MFLIIGQVFLLHPPVHVSEGDNLSISFFMDRSKENHRLMEVEFECAIQQRSGNHLTDFKKKYYIEWHWWFHILRSSSIIQGRFYST